MDDHYITAGELALLVGIFVGPILIGAAVTQFFLLRQAGFRSGPVVGMVIGSAVLTLLLAWGLIFVLPPTASGSYGGPLMAPALIAAIVVTSSIAVIAKRRRLGAR